MTVITPYIDIPACAAPIIPSRLAAQAGAPAPRPRRAPSFPPSAPAAPPSRKFTVPTSAASLSTNMSDMVLNSLLPANLPKMQPSVKVAGMGKVRELSSQREALSLPLVSNNFRRFVTKVGPVFWLQDRMEEVFFWRKPKWTWAYLAAWTFIAFRPRLLLLLPSATLILLLLHVHERTHPLPSLLGVKTSPASATTRTSVSPVGNVTASTGPEGEIPVVPPKEAESGVDYYMNLQAIQNLMGLISDIYDYLAPRLAQMQNPVSSPNAFPLTTTHLILVLLPPTLFLPLLPASLLPYLLLPIGYAGPLFFHPAFTPALLALPRNPTLLRARAMLEGFCLTDGLSDDIGRQPITRVEVWENERLDPAIAAKSPAGPLAPVSFSSKHLRAAERAPWIKVLETDSVWKAETKEEKKEGDKMALALQPGWEFVPGEEWRVDVCGLWSEVGTDEDGWTYTDDSWQNSSPTASTEAGVTADKQLPGLALRRLTRKRRWFRRVYRREDDLAKGV